jgi:hypothetical protein
MGIYRKTRNVRIAQRIKLTMRSKALAVLLVLLCIGSSAQSSSHLCDASVLPSGVSELLKSRFEGWRIRTAEDMEEYDRQLWTKSKPDACPGITPGRFLSATKKTFVVLLVPEKPDLKGYKIIAFDQADSNGSFTPVVIEDNPTQSAADLAIFQLAPQGFTLTRTARVESGFSLMDCRLKEWKSAPRFTSAGGAL